MLPVGRHTLSVTFTPADSERYATAHASVLLVVEKLPNIDTMLTEPAQTPFTQSSAADFSDFTDMKPAPEIGTLKQKSQRETRTYKGALYEKGEDGQWHLQQK